METLYNPLSGVLYESRREVLSLVPPRKKSSKTPTSSGTVVSSDSILTHSHLFTFKGSRLTSQYLLMGTPCRISEGPVCVLSGGRPLYFKIPTEATTFSVFLHNVL